MPTRARISALKRRHGPALLRVPGVVGVGVGHAANRDADAEDYALLVYLSSDRATTRLRVQDIVGTSGPIRFVRSGRFGPR